MIAFKNWFMMNKKAVLIGLGSLLALGVVWKLIKRGKSVKYGK